MAKTANHVSPRYAVIIGPGPHWFHELQSSWFERRSQIHTSSEQNTACALLFALFSAQFLVHFLSNGGDRGLLVRVISKLRQYSFDVLSACGELTASL